MALQQTLKALSDPTRREILNLLKSGRLSAGEIADHFSIPPAAVFLQPLLLLAAHYLVLFFVFRDAKNRNQSKKVVGLLFWIMPATSILVSGITYAVALGWKFRLAGLLYVGLGLMFAAIGNYFPKCRPNRTVGIRISWTLGSEENWNATHRFAGKV